MCAPAFPTYRPPEPMPRQGIVIDATEGEIRDWIAAINDMRDMRVRLKKLLHQMKAARCAT